MLRIVHLQTTWQYLFIVDYVFVTRLIKNLQRDIWLEASLGKTGVRYQLF